MCRVGEDWICRVEDKEVMLGKGPRVSSSWFVVLGTGLSYWEERPTCLKLLVFMLVFTSSSVKYSGDKVTFSSCLEVSSLLLDSSPTSIYKDM